MLIRNLFLFFLQVAGLWLSHWLLALLRSLFYKATCSLVSYVSTFFDLLGGQTLLFCLRGLTPTGFQV